MLKTAQGMTIISLLTACLPGQASTNEPIWSIRNHTPHAVDLRSAVPAGCPLPASGEITGFVFTGRYANYTTADTWYPSWAADGQLYSPWTDGSIHGIYKTGGKPECHSTTGYAGQARIEGNDPMNLKIVSLGTTHSPTAPYAGRYPCGTLVHNGVWYYGTYGLIGPYMKILGPFPGFRISTDYGKTWQQTPHDCTPGRSLFPEPDTFQGPVKFGAPHFVDFGQNMQHSPDGKAYLIAHGSIQHEGEDRTSNLSWITGDRIYLCRVFPSPQTINEENAYEYFAGHDDAGRPVWSDDFQDVKPLIDWDNHCGCVTMTYNAPLKKYFMCITDGWPNNKSPMDTYILESDHLTGPWKMVIYMAEFGPQGYFVNIPSKFIQPDGKTFWLCYSANYTDKPNWTNPGHLKTTRPPGSTYAMSLHEVTLEQNR